MKRRPGRGRRPSPRWIIALLVLLLGLVGLGPGPSSAGGEAIVRSSGARTRPVVALTFDDGISPPNCRRILAELVGRGIPATFFPIATAMSLDPAFWRLVGEAGYPIGDHTMTHPEMPQLTLSQQEWQIGEARVVAESITGRTLLRVFRPPYGAYDAATLVAAEATGFPLALLWDVSARDTSLHGTLAEMVAAAEQGRAGSVILMHCGPNATPYLVPQILDYYRTQGYGFVTVPDLFGLSWQPGPTRVISPATILGGLSPLPPTSSGGPITGPNGYVPSPGASAAEAASASPTAEATAVAPSLPPDSGGAPGTQPSGSAPVSPAPASGAGGADGALLVVALLTVAALAAVAIVATGTLARRRSR